MRDVKVLVGTGSPVTSERMTFGVTMVPAGNRMDPHSHGQEEIIYVLSGRGYVDIDGAKEILEPGTVVKLPSDSTHCICNDSGEELQFTFCFNPPVQVGSYDRK